MYDPLAEAENLAMAALRVRADDSAAATAFVNSWGPLGVGVFGDRLMDIVESVALTKDMLIKFQTLARLYRHLDAGRSLAALDPAEALQLLPRLRSAAERDPRRIWAAFSEALYPFLGRTALGIRWEPGAGRLPMFGLTRLYEVLFLTLWHWATAGMALRPCRLCRHLFVVGRADQFYCAHRCASHAAVRRFRLKNG